MRRTIRLICQEIDYSLGAPVQTRWKTFELELPEDAAAWLSAFEDDGERSLRARYIEAAELVEPKA